MSDEPVPAADLTIQVLRSIQSSMAELISVTRANGEAIRANGSRLDRLERHAVVTHELLETSVSRLAFLERTTSAMHLARERDDARFAGIEARLQRLEDDRG